MSKFISHAPYFLANFRNHETVILCKTVFGFGNISIMLTSFGDKKNNGGYSMNFAFELH